MFVFVWACVGPRDKKVSKYKTMRGLPWITISLITSDAIPWWRHQMETFSALLAICAENSRVTCEFPAQRPVTWSFGVFFYLRLNKPLSKQWRGWWFETLSTLWRHYDVAVMCQRFCVTHENHCRKQAPVKKSKAPIQTARHYFIFRIYRWVCFKKDVTPVC